MRELGKQGLDKETLIFKAPFYPPLFFSSVPMFECVSNCTTYATSTVHKTHSVSLTAAGGVCRRIMRVALVVSSRERKKEREGEKKEVFRGSQRGHACVSAAI